MATCFDETKCPYLYLWSLTALLRNSFMRMQLNLFLLNLEWTIMNLVSMESIWVSLMFMLIGLPNIIPTNFLFLAILTPIKIDDIFSSYSIWGYGNDDNYCFRSMPNTHLCLARSRDSSIGAINSGSYYVTRTMLPNCS